MTRMDPDRGAYFQQVCAALNLNEDQQKIVRDFMARATISHEDPAIWMLGFVAKHELASQLLNDNIASMPDLIRELWSEGGLNIITEMTTAIQTAMSGIEDSIIDRMASDIRDPILEALAKITVPAFSSALPSPVTDAKPTAPVTEIVDEETGEVTEVADEDEPLSIEGMDDFRSAGFNLAQQFKSDIADKLAEDDLDGSEFERVGLVGSDKKVLTPQEFDDAVRSINDCLQNTVDSAGEIKGAFLTMADAVTSAHDEMSELSKDVAAEMENASKVAANKILEVTGDLKKRLPADIAKHTATAAEPHFIEMRKTYEDKLKSSEIAKYIRFTIAGAFVAILMLMAAVAGGFMVGQSTLSAKATDIERMVSTDTGRQWYSLWKINEGVDPVSQCSGDRVSVFDNARICKASLWLDPAPASMPNDGRFLISPLTWMKTQLPFWSSLLIAMSVGAFLSWVAMTRLSRTGA